MGHVEPINKRFLEAGAVEGASRLYQIWRRENRRVTDEVVTISPRLVINTWTLPDSDPPPILFAGADSLVAKLHGPDFLSAHTDANQIPNRKVRDLARDGYVAAYHGEPVYDLVSCDLGSWERLILPFWTRPGVPTFFTLCLPIGPIRTIDRSDRERRSGGYIPASCPAETAAGLSSI